LRVLVTGGAGFIGSHVVDLLLAKGYDVTVVDSLRGPTHPKNEVPDYVPRKASFIHGDVCSREPLRRALGGVDAVFHFAAQQDNLPFFSRFARTNDYGTALLFETIIARRLPVRKVILASSQAIYGEGRHSCEEHGTQLPDPRPLDQLLRGKWDLTCTACRTVLQPLATDERTPPRPSSHYGVSKFCQEQWAMTLGHRYQLPTVALRYSITQGPRQSPYNAYSGVLRTFVTRLLSNQSPTIYEDGNQVRDYMHVRDAAEASLLALEDERSNHQIFNVGGATEPCRVRDYFAIIARCLDVQTEPEIPGKFRFGDTRHIFSDSSKLRALGWKPRFGLESIVRDYIGWIKNMNRVPDEYATAERVLRTTGALLDVKRGR